MVEGGTAHGEKIVDQLCLEVPPAPVYKGARGRPPAKGGEARQEESYSYRE